MEFNLKLEFGLKSPDVISDTIRAAAEIEWENLPKAAMEEEKEYSVDEIEDALKEKLSKFIKWGEYITVRVKICGDDIIAEVVPAK